MIDVKEAVAKAVEFVVAVLGPPSVAGLENLSALSSEATARSILLEEVDIDKHNGNDVWLITLSFPRRLGLPDIGSAFSGGRREYKTFTVDRQTGEVLSMKIRELAA